MTCEQFESKLLDYIDGDLDKEESNRVMLHVNECKTCSALLERYQNQENLLTKYYQTTAKAALGVPKPVIEAPGIRTAPVHRSYSFLIAAAAVILFMVSGGSFFIYHSIKEAKSGRQIGIALDVMGKVQYFKGNKLIPIDEGMPIRSNMRLKTPKNSYLAVELLTAKKGKESNIVEFKDNSVGTFLVSSGKMEILLERGEVWIHLNQKMDNPIQVKTRQLNIREIGTIFNVAQGLTGTSVGVVTGSVEFDINKAKKVMKSGEFFTTYGDLSGDNIRRHIAWSRYREKLLSLLSKEGEAKMETADTTQQQLRVSELPKPTLTPEIPQDESLGSLETTQLMPMDTRLFFEVSNVAELIQEWNASDYSRLFTDPALVQWWESDQVQEFRNKINTDIGVSKWLKLIDSFKGSMSFSIPSSEGFILVADCRQNVGEIQALLENEIQPLLKHWKELPFNNIWKNMEIQMKRGYFIICHNPVVLSNTLTAIKEDKPTGFTETQFYTNLTTNVPRSRMTIAYDFRSTVQAAWAKNNPQLNKFLERTGFDSLDYILGSPDFSGRGINQAFRVAFTGTRHGIAGWLDEPAPMGSLRYFAPDTHILVAARIKRPLEMLTDVINWHIEDRGRSDFSNEDMASKAFQDMSACLGNEIAFGIQNPVLPIPNIQFVIEILDPVKFHEALFNVIDLFKKGNPNQTFVLESRDYRDQLIITLSVEGFKTDISFAVLDDYLIVGLGEPFLRHTIDTFVEKQSLIDDYSFHQLLPETGQMNFSLLIYQDIARELPKVLNNFSSAKLNQREQSFLPNFDVISKFRSASLSYAFSNDKYIDFYIKSSTGIDFNMGGALPLVASLITPRLFEHDLNWKIKDVQYRIRTALTACEAYYVDNNRYPQSFSELLTPVAYLTEIPTDPFSEKSSSPLQYTVSQNRDAYVIYSVGPDGVDGYGVTLYDPTNGVNSSGDIRSGREDLHLAQ